MDYPEENVGMVQNTFNKLKNFTMSTEKIDKLEDIELDNMSSLVQSDSSSSLYKLSYNKLTQYGSTIISGYTSPLTSVMASGTTQ